MNKIHKLNEHRKWWCVGPSVQSREMSTTTSTTTTIMRMMMMIMIN